MTSEQKLEATRSMLITGGTGSFGQAFVETILKDYPHIERLVVYSRDELKQFEMEQKFPRSDFPQMRYFIGDVRDESRLKRACDGIDTIIHAAALKQVPAAEQNPMECILTNVMGARNIINAAMDCGVSKVVALSTDKAAAPINLYGATKLCSDKLFVAANNMVGKRNLRFSVVRYGNVMGSRGSVIPFFLRQRKTGILPITHPEMTRFNISLKGGVEMVVHSLTAALGGEILVPKIPSYRITDVAEAIGPDCEKKIIGIRAGEKIHEEMITRSDSFMTADLGKYFAIVPQTHRFSIEDYCEQNQGTKVELGFHYNSGNNDQWLDVPTLRSLIKEHVDPNFS
eukprot:COSAG01_NODE_9817_length_2333_cov_7.812089_2_plen_342_part_00